MCYIETSAKFAPRWSFNNSRKASTTESFEVSSWLTDALLHKMISIKRAGNLVNLPAPLQPLLASRLYATQTGLGTTNASPRPRRKAVTTFNDDGRVPWGDLTAREKAARTTQQTFNFGLIIAGVALTVCSKLP